MKNFSQFLKEEVDLKGNKGVPEDFMSKAKQQATKNLGIQPETNRPVGDISSLIARSTYLLTNGLNRDQIEERYKKLEDLAKRVKELRKRNGMSQELLAENSGLSWAFLKYTFFDTATLLTWQMA